MVSLLLALTGLADSAYLTWEHFNPSPIPCSDLPFTNCGAVLSSDYAMVFGIVPLAVLGVLYYATFAVSALVYLIRPRIVLLRWLFLLSSAGFLASLWFVFLQLVVIKAICIYCMISAVTSCAQFLWLRITRFHEYRLTIIFVLGFTYRHLVKRIFFLIDPEYIHHVLTGFGELLGAIRPVKAVLRIILGTRYPVLEQVVAGITFHSPVGLAAGFDYEAKLTQTLEPLGFGFQTVGTITNQPCEGNPRPRLGRLPMSRSLLVNKGFRNPGAKAIIRKLRKQSFPIPLGVSIGTTNSSSITTLEEAVDDIISAFQLFEASKVQHAYYELNISCPNLQVGVSFYDTGHLDTLLTALDKLKLKKPVFVKMPIELDDAPFIALLDVIVTHSPAGVIIGNLLKNRKDKALRREEVRKCGKGNFSGKPTESRSNELIQLSYTHTGGNMIIIGCGGIFSADDAYRKITLGASLVQLISGMIFQGPQLVSEINAGLVERLRKDGYIYISEAVGTRATKKK
ncbi:MAG: quinone-dependent dihydroorotate dehydrogenase [Patescibacteria group bacterium]|nr:quinone-dependent dihydroorotate dehydrogenase [Patescibacteria group bacterium]